MSFRSKSKIKNHSSSDSDSDDKITFTKIKKIYKCGICDKKIKNYCKCGTNVSPHSGSNIITIMTNPECENKQKDIFLQKGEKGEKGEKGLTGSMGLTGNSFVIFTTNQQVNSGDFIGIGYSDKEFIKSSITIPYEFLIKQIGFSIKNSITSKCTATLYINNKLTDYIISICDGLHSQKSFNSIVKIKPTDLFCFKISFESGNLSNGVCINIVIN